MRGDPLGGMLGLGLGMEGTDQLGFGIELDDVLHLFRLAVPDGRSCALGGVEWCGTTTPPITRIGGVEECGRRRDR